MKNTLKVLIGGLGIVLPICFSSCSKDEPGDAIEFDGMRISSINDYYFSYDSQGRVTSIDGDYDYVEFNYSKGTIELDEDEMSVKYNGQGFISSMESSWNETEGSYKYQGSGKIDFSYNGDGYLTKITINTSETTTYLDTNKKSKGESNGTVNVTWNKGNLVKASGNFSETYDGETEKWSYVTSVSYDEDNNQYQQFPVILFETVFEADDVFPMIAAVGLFGKGPKYLPDYYEYEEYEDGYDDYEFESYLNISLNSNGAISRESDKYSKYTYDYEKSAKTKSFFDLSGDKKTKVRDLFIIERRNTK